MASVGSPCLQPGPLGPNSTFLQLEVCKSAHVPLQLRSFCGSHHLILRLGSDSALSLGMQSPTPLVTLGSLLPCHTGYLLSFTASWGLLFSVFPPSPGNWLQVAGYFVHCFVLVPRCVWHRLQFNGLSDGASWSEFGPTGSVDARWGMMTWGWRGT